MMSKVLIILFSRKGNNYIGGNIVDLKKGNTEVLTDFVCRSINADVFKIRPVKEYSDDYMECTRQAQEEVRTKEMPELLDYPESLEEYRDIIIAGPNWWGRYPMPMYSLLSRFDLSGKNLYPVVTHEGSGEAGILESLKEICPGAVLMEALVIPGGEVQHSEGLVKEWIDKHHLGER